MEISFDAQKRAKTLKERNIDFADAGEIFNGPHFTLIDDRHDYPETRFQTYGYIKEPLVMIAWCETKNGIRVISMRKCNDREKAKFESRLE